MSELRSSRLNDRGLWSAVVLQAIADIESQPTRQPLPRPSHSSRGGRVG